MKNSTFVHVDGSISSLLVDAIIQKNDDWRKTPHGINHRYVIVSEHDGHLDTVKLVKLPTGARGLTIMHEPT